MGLFGVQEAREGLGFGVDKGAAADVLGEAVCVLETVDAQGFDVGGWVEGQAAGGGVVFGES